MPLRSASGVAVADMPAVRHSTSASALRPAAGRRSADVAMASPDALLVAHVERLWTPLAPALAPDTSLLNRLDRVELSGAAAVVRCHSAAAAAQAAEDGAHMCSSAMRGSFHGLTAALLAPFAPFVTPTPPPWAPGAAVALHCATSGPPLPPFDAAAFLASLLAPISPPLPRALVRRVGGSHTAACALYARFIAGAPFRAWLAARRAAAEAQQAASWAAARATAGVANLTAALSEVELIDAFCALEASLEASLEAAHVNAALSAAAVALSAGPPGAKLSFGAGMDSRGASASPLAPAPESSEIGQLRADLRAMLDAMPADMRSLLASHPQRAALLGLPPLDGYALEGEAAPDGGRGLATSGSGRLGGLLTGALAAARGR